MDKLYLYLYSQIYNRAKEKVIDKKEAKKILMYIHRLEQEVAEDVLDILIKNKLIVLENIKLRFTKQPKYENGRGKDYMTNYMREYRKNKFKW